MLPSVVARQVKQGITDFLQTTFPVTTSRFDGALDRLLAREDSIFKGPFISIQLPFRTGSGRDHFAAIKLPFSPYLHQEKAFARLGGSRPASTIIATGTGSGKTESFLLPVLDYCWQHRGEPGIKAILIYPMNALATDQAGRLAEAIHKNPELRDKVTAGIYVGQEDETPSAVMAADRIITDKKLLRKSPPDILITNYKMLDYLLLRIKDQTIWKQNQPETLKFLVVDELHTFDGAQGSDLACLIRRLKARLATPAGHLCCVGTSATLGNDAEGGTLLKYAGEVFGETFTPDAVISEYRLSAGEFLESHFINRTMVPPPAMAARLQPETWPTAPAYLRAQHELWFDEPLDDATFAGVDWRLALPQKLLQHSFFQNLLKLLRGRPRSYNEIISELEKYTPEFLNAPQQYKSDLIDSLLALVAAARNGTVERPAPFLHVRFQLWLRELTRMTGLVAPVPEIAFADDLTQEQLATHLPLIHCRECNKMGWAGLKREFDEQINGELRAFYSSFFKADPEVAFFFPEAGSSRELEKAGSFFQLCTGCLALTKKTEARRCHKCDNPELIRVYMPETIVVKEGRRSSSNCCPFCNTQGSLTILGSRAASLTSVAISQIFASNFNNDKKLLTFSDSVQDAAHRAGFFAGRTYTFNFRIALQKFVQTLSAPVDLATLPGMFVDFWLARLGPERFITTFIGPNMTWLQEYEKMLASGRVDPADGLLELVKKRVHWQILSEYGFRARIGRTLERAGSSMAVVNGDLLARAVAAAYFTLINEVGMLRNLNETKVKQLACGLLMHLKNLGGIYYSELDCLIDAWGETFMLNRINWTPDFSPKARTPAFLTTRRTNRFELLTRSGSGRHTWCEIWLEKLLAADNELIAGLAPQVYELLLQALIKEGILVEFKPKGDRVWGIKPEAMLVERKVSRFACCACNRQIAVGSGEASVWAEAPCIEPTCGGFFKEVGPLPDYYGKLYSTGDVERIFAAEHTGLLERTPREELERRFRNSNQLPGAPNLLSCTPTLELGINIGELSTVVLCSVPPAQANYLQRIGRAGRQDGNSLNLTVANSRPHDLYFFADPSDMIAGRVEAPGVFLNASAVLERQLTAYCFDRWAASGVKESALPVNLQKVLYNIDKPDSGKFPYNLLAYIKLNQTVLFEGFIAMFKEVISPESVEHLKNFMLGSQSNHGSLEYRIINRLLQQNRSIEGLRSRIKTLVNKIAAKKEQLVRDANYQSELEELMMEKKGLNDLVQDLGSKHILNFFTDEGLLPNYAFPEAGVTLRSVIFRKKTKKTDDGGNYETLRFEYERSAGSAISELAPSSVFYAGGRRVTIDQVDLSVSDIETWQMCDNCSLMTREISSQAAANCPACGSSQWGNVSQKRQMLRLTQVFSTSHDRDSRLNDDSDERDTRFFNRQMVVELRDAERIAAFKIDSDELPFGFEFYTRAGFRDINFGERDGQAEKFRVNGAEMGRRGFTICRYCGKVQNAKGEIKHSLSCVSRKKESAGNLTNCVYLYREFHSEAIMMLMPFVTGASGKELHSFIAAVNLGLKRKFGGNIGHLQLTLHDEPIPDSTQRKQYLVLYDTVPGGTGYLKQLMRSGEPMLEVFELALNVLRNCECSRQNGAGAQDGCYRCLFAYKQSYNMAGTSRSTAIDLLTKILEHRDRLVSIKSLEEVSVNALLDSNLEAGFIEILRRCGRQLELPVVLKLDVVNNKPGYYLKIGEQAWHIEPQVLLGGQYGINAQVQSKADFVFYPVKGCKNNKPLVVFTDGYGFHWNRTDKDFAQRDAILKTGRFNLWLLSYNDVELHLAAEKLKNFCEELIDTGLQSVQSKFIKLLASYKTEALPNPASLDSFSLLLKWMLSGDERRWQLNAFAMALLLLDNKTLNATEAMRWKNRLEALCPVEVCAAFNDAFADSDAAVWRYGEHRFESAGFSIELKLAINDESIRKGDVAGMYIACCLDDSNAAPEDYEYRRYWNGFLKLVDILQFLPNAYFFTVLGRAMPYGKPVVGSEAAADSWQPAGEWQELIEVVDPIFRAFLLQIAGRGLPLPEADMELRHENGRLVCDEVAALAWPEHKVAIAAAERQEWFAHFSDHGWQVLALTEVADASEKLEQYLKAKE